jgi:hypothetical protein
VELEIYRKGIEMPITVDVDEYPQEGEDIVSYLHRAMGDRNVLGIGRRIIYVNRAEWNVDTVVLAGAEIDNMETRGGYG